MQRFFLQRHRAIPYIEFQTQIVKLFEKVSQDKLLTKQAFIELIHNPNLFKKIEDQHYQLKMMWPYHNDERSLFICASIETENDKFSKGSLQFRYDGHYFLTI